MSKQKGMTLVETLVALVVLSIGLLGVAGLQMASLRSNHSAHLRSQGTALAYDIIDRMRANRNAALGGAYDVALGANVAGATMAAIDVTAWKAAVAAALTNGDGSIARNGNIFTVTIQWDDTRGENDADAIALEDLQFVTQTRL